jgi:hypothetical protein
LWDPITQRLDLAAGLHINTAARAAFAIHRVDLAAKEAPNPDALRNALAAAWPAGLEAEVDVADAERWAGRELGELLKSPPAGDDTNDPGAHLLRAADDAWRRFRRPATATEKLLHEDRGNPPPAETAVTVKTRLDEMRDADCREELCREVDALILVPDKADALCEHIAETLPGRAGSALEALSERGLDPIGGHLEALKADLDEATGLDPIGGHLEALEADLDEATGRRPPRHAPDELQVRQRLKPILQRLIHHRTACELALRSLPGEADHMICVKYLGQSPRPPGVQGRPRASRQWRIGGELVTLGEIQHNTLFRLCRSPREHVAPEDCGSDRDARKMRGDLPEPLKALIQTNDSKLRFNPALVKLLRLPHRDP